MNGTEASVEFPPPPQQAVAAAEVTSTADYSRREFALREWMDEPCTFADYRAAALNLGQANRLTLGYRPTLAFIERVVAERGVTHEPLHVVDVGCGHGDMLRVVARWAARRSVPLHLTGIDANPYASRLARECDRNEHVAAKTITWITAEVFDPELALERAPEIILSSLFTHHLDDASIVRFLGWSETHAQVGWFVNDLTRSERPAKIFAWMARLLRWHPMVAHDGPVSFRRAFTADDWQRYLREADVDAARIFAARPARLCVERLKVATPSETLCS